MIGSTPKPAEIITRPSDISFAHGGVSPTAPLYVTADDRLTIRVWNSLTAAEVGISARMLTPTGQIAVVRKSLRPTNDRLENRIEVPLAEGWLISVVAGNFTGLPSIGQTFVLCELNRGGTTGLDLATLISNYLGNDCRRAAWPGGKLISPTEGPGLVRDITGTDPAAGADIAEQVPVNTRWRLQSISFFLVTAVAAANREVRLFTSGGAGFTFQAGSNIAQVASLTRRYVGAPMGAMGQSSTDTLLIPLPIPTMLPAGSLFGTNTLGLQAADDYGPPTYRVEEWIEG